MAAHVSFLLQCQCFISVLDYSRHQAGMLLLGSPKTCGRLSWAPPSPPGPARFLAPLRSLKRAPVPSPGASPALAKPTLVRLSAVGLPDSSLVKVARNLQVANFHLRIPDLCLVCRQQHLTLSPPPSTCASFLA